MTGSDHADRPLQRFLQIDGLVGRHPDGDILPGDVNGDCLMRGITDELTRSPSAHQPICVLIHEDARPEDVRRLLVKLLEELDETFGFLREQTERDLLSRAGVQSESPF